MHKNKRKKRLSRKQKRINANRKWWANLIERNKEWLEHPMPQLLCRDYLDKNKTTLHSESFISIICDELDIPSQELNPI